MNSIAQHQIEQLNEQFSLCQTARRALINELAQYVPSQQLICSLPKWLQTRPLDKIDQIEPEAITGSQAQPLLLAAISDLTRQADDLQSQKVRRYPGVFRFSSNHNLLALNQQLEQRLFEFKNALHRHTASASNKQDLRYELLHRFLPNLITMHFYRSPVVLNRPIKRVRFGWVGKRIIAKTTQQQVLQRLNNALLHPGKVIHDIPAWNQCVMNEIRSIESLSSSTELRIDRPGGLRPTAFIQYCDGGRWQTPANLPLLALQAEPFEVIALPKWHQQTFPEAKGKLLIPRLHLYRIN